MLQGRRTRMEEAGSRRVRSMAAAGMVGLMLLLLGLPSVVGAQPPEQVLTPTPTPNVGVGLGVGMVTATVAVSLPPVITATAAVGVSLPTPVATAVATVAGAVPAVPTLPATVEAGVGQTTVATATVGAGAAVPLGPTATVAALAQAQATAMASTGAAVTTTGDQVTVAGDALVTLCLDALASATAATPAGPTSAELTAAARSLCANLVSGGNLTADTQGNVTADANALLSLCGQALASGAGQVAGQAGGTATAEVIALCETLGVDVPATASTTGPSPGISTEPTVVNTLCVEALANAAGGTVAGPTSAALAGDVRILCDILMASLPANVTPSSIDVAPSLVNTLCIAATGVGTAQAGGQTLAQLTGSAAELCAAAPTPLPTPAPATLPAPPAPLEIAGVTVPAGPIQIVAVPAGVQISPTGGRITLPAGSVLTTPSGLVTLPRPIIVEVRGVTEVARPAAAGPAEAQAAPATVRLPQTGSPVAPTAPISHGGVLGTAALVMLTTSAGLLRFRNGRGSWRRPPTR